MLKKLLLIVLLCGGSMHAMEQPDTFKYVPKPDHSLRNFVGSVALIALLDAAPKIDKYIEEYAKTLNEEELKKLITRINRIVLAMQVAVGIYAVVAFYPMCKDLYDYLYPSEAKKAAIQAAIQQNKIFNAEHNFVDCLLNNMNTPSNETGLPTACENFGEIYRAVAGEAAFDEMKSRVN